MTTATQSEFARQQNLSKSYITKLKGEGRLVFTDDGLVDVERSIARIEATRDPNRDDVAARHAAQRAQEYQQQENQSEKIGSSYQAARAVKEKFLALTAKLEYERSLGSMVTAESVRQSAQAAGVAIRAVLENLPDQLAPMLAAEVDEARVHALLVEAVEDVLQRAADSLEVSKK